MNSDIFVGMYGPEWEDFRTDEGADQYGCRLVHVRAPFMVQADTLGLALKVYTRYFKSTLAPYDGPLPKGWNEKNNQRKYFLHTASDYKTQILDIHIMRGEDEICPKQDLDFALQYGDIVHVGVILVC